MSERAESDAEAENASRTINSFSRRLIRGLIQAALRFVSLIASAFLLGLSLLPLSALLLAFPAVMPEESVLSDTVKPSRNLVFNILRRLFALLTAFVVLIALLAMSIELATWLKLAPTGQFGYIARSLLGWSLPDGLVNLFPPDARAYFSQPIYAMLPAVMIEHWPHVVLFVYLFDLLLLLAVGKVPLQYNYRNLIVRWRITGLTALAFVVVVGLMVGMLAFVNGLNNLCENTGIPGNVFILSDGANDEIFSNLGYGELDNVERATTSLDEYDRPLAKVVGVKKDKDSYWASRETYYVLNMPVRDKNGQETGRRRFSQLRTLEDGETAGKVHNIQLYPNGRWFSAVAVQELPDGKSAIECVLGEGMAHTMGADMHRGRLDVGDTFPLGSSIGVIVGVMKSEGSTFGSEIWTRRSPLIYEPFGKRSYTTLVVRTDAGTADSARAFAWHLKARYQQQKLKAVPEQQYYSELNKTNRQFLGAFSIVALIMSIGSVFGVMNTMFAAIASRIRDIGVLRLLGFKRWQVLVSFMLESLLIAIVGGLLGCCVGFLIDGRQATGIVSGTGGGGGKSVALNIDVSPEIIVCGLLFTLVIGRLGGLVPALSAIRMKMLDSLK